VSIELMPFSGSLDELEADRFDRVVADDAFRRYGASRSTRHVEQQVADVAAHLEDGGLFDGFRRVRPGNRARTTEATRGFGRQRAGTTDVAKRRRRTRSLSWSYSSTASTRSAMDPPTAAASPDGPTERSRPREEDDGGR